MSGVFGYLHGVIEKGKKYVIPKTSPPKGVIIHKGPKGVHFYYVEDRHVKHMGREHILVRSKGVIRDQFDAITEKYQSQGAELVRFIHKPGLKRDRSENLYSILI